MKQLRNMVYGLLIGLLAGGAIFLISQPERGAPISLSPAPTPTITFPPKPSPTPKPIQVQIGGEIVNPGIFTLPHVGRLTDLIDLAGGLTDGADIDRVNFAALLHDGDYFYIPAVDESIPETARNAPNNAHSTNVANFNYPLNLNETTQEALETLPDIGPAKAIAILEYRDEIGAFSSVDELLNVPGIGEVILESIREFVTVEP